MVDRERLRVSAINHMRIGLALLDDAGDLRAATLLQHGIDVAEGQSPMVREDDRPETLDRPS